MRFGPGAEVCGVEFSSDDYCEVRISCEQQASVTEQVQDYLATLGEVIPKSCITSMEGCEGTCHSTYIRVKDQDYAETLKAQLGSFRHLNPGFKVDIKHRSLDDWSTSCFSDISSQMDSIRCYWPRPSRKALLHFDTITHAKEAEKILNDAEIRIHGRRINARYKAPHGHFGLPGVRIRYLDTNATYQTIINKLPLNVRPVAIKLEDPSYLTTFPDVKRAMMELLSRYGPVEDCQVTEKCNSRESRAIVRFRNFADAQAVARELDGYRLPEIGHSQLMTRPNVSLRFREIPGSVFDVLIEEMCKLREDLHEIGQVRMEVGYETNHGQRESIGIQLDGRHVSTVAKAKRALQNLLAGDVAMWGPSKLWDKWFAKSKGSTFFAALNAIHKGFVRVDVNTEQIFLYGSAEVREGMQNAIVNELVMQQRQSIVLRDPKDHERAMQGVCRKIVEPTAHHGAGMYVGSSTEKMTINGAGGNFDAATHLSHEPNLRIHENNNSKPDCSVCLSPASDPFQTTCGHTYCKSCFAHQCSAATSNGTIPIRCLGDSDNCSHIFTLEELKSFLTHKSFEQLLETSLAQYVRSNPKFLRHCPTPDCPSIYPLTTKWDTMLCHSCLNFICINCQAQDHDGMSCEAYQAAIKGEEEFTKWKEEHNVKECPECDAPIEKIDGCNHVECTNCTNHICWQCMASYSTGPEVYKHMQEEHGTFVPLGEGWEEEEDDDDEEDDEDEEEDDDDEEDAAFTPELELAAREIPNVENPLNHQGHGPPIPAAQPPTPPPAVPTPLPFNHARMDDAFFENILPPAPPPTNPAPLDTPPAQGPPTQPPTRRHTDEFMNAIIWLTNMFRNVAPRARHLHLPEPQPPDLATNNDIHMTEADDEQDTESDSDSDLSTTASSRSHTTASDIPAAHSYPESDDDEELDFESPPFFDDGMY